MNITYDKDTDTAYINLAENRASKDVELTYTCDAQQIDGIINLEFNSSGRLLGIEVLNAREKLPQELLEVSENN